MIVHEKNLYFCVIETLVKMFCDNADKDRNGDVVNGETSGELTPSSDGDSVTLDAAVDTAVHGKVYRQDIITITGRRENCEAARHAMLVCNIDHRLVLYSLYFSASWVSQCWIYLRKFITVTSTNQCVQRKRIGFQKLWFS